jgi:hypothetical protein
MTQRSRISKVMIAAAMPRESVSPSGVIGLAEGMNVAKGLDTERVAGEWWPESGRVVENYGGMVRHGMHETGEEVFNGDTKQYVRKLDHTYHAWDLPAKGETAYFGYKDMNPNGKDVVFLKGDNEGEVNVLVESSRAYAVRGLDGKLRGCGAWCVVEQIPEEVDGGPLITKIKVGSELGIGVVRLVGDGFSERQPSIRPGMVVKFKVSGSNPVVPNPDGGDPLVRILAEWVVGIDSDGMSDEELATLKMAAKANDEAVRQALGNMVNIIAEDDIAKKARISKEIEAASWADSRKKRDGMPLGSKRKYF